MFSADHQQHMLMLLGHVHVCLTGAQGQRLLCRYLQVVIYSLSLFNLIILEEFQLRTLWAEPSNYPCIWSQLQIDFSDVCLSFVHRSEKLLLN